MPDHEASHRSRLFNRSGNGRFLFRRRTEQQTPSTSSREQPNPKFDLNVDERGRAQLDLFPKQVPDDVPAPITMPAVKVNHASMGQGSVQWNLGQTLEKGDVGAGFGDDFCMVHGITRVFVLDPQNHVVALVSPMRYLMYQAYKMYTKERLTDIFQFLRHACAPRWAMRAPAKQILAGQSGGIQRHGDTVSISGSRMGDDGKQCLPEVIFENIPYSGISWVAMDKWLEEAKSHFVSFVVADTGITGLLPYDRTKTLPLALREDEADLIMAQAVYGLISKDQRFENSDLINEETIALQFREGWYAPKCNGVTRIMRLLKRSEDPQAVEDRNGDGKWLVESAYSKKFVPQPSRDMWYIGGVNDVHEDALAKELGTHLELTLDLSAGSGGLQGRKWD